MSIVPVANTAGVFFQPTDGIRHYYGNQAFLGNFKFLQSSSPSIVNTSSLAVSASATTHDRQQAAAAAANVHTGTSAVSVNGHVAASTTTNRGAADIGHEDEQRRLGLDDYFQQSAELVATTCGGPPRWFSPLECGSRLKDSPLLLFLPELVKLVESTVRVEYSRAPGRPIYLVGETFGACLALAVAARNHDIDLILILANPATAFNKSSLLLQPQSLMHLLTMVPQQLRSGLPHMLLLGTLPVMAAAKTGKGLPFQQVIEELSGDSVALSSYLSKFINLKNGGAGPL